MEHFLLCDACEDKLHNVFTNLDKSHISFSDQNCITLEHIKRGWQFNLNFVLSPDYNTFRPCSKCQKAFKKKMLNKEFHIGNRVEPVVELWRKWEPVD